MASMNEDITFHEESSRDRLLKYIKEAEERLAAQSSPAQSRKPKIQRVPHMLRGHKNYEKYYNPKVIAVGPFHHGTPQCEVGEKFKPALAARFIEDSDRQADDLLKIIEDNIKILRDCYDEESTKLYSDEALAQLLFLDGCSTLQFIYSIMQGEWESFKIKRDQVAFARTTGLVLARKPTAVPSPHVVDELKQETCGVEDRNRGICSSDGNREEINN